MSEKKLEVTLSECFFYAAMHIQCSDSTYQLLEKLGGFTLDSRGAIEVKVKTSTIFTIFIRHSASGEGVYEHMVVEELHRA